MALNAFSVSKREARYEADLVNCRASMCNIKYQYDEDDKYVVALQKALNSLRHDHKITIYNFLVSTAGASGEVDSCFQEQCNAAIVKGKFSDIPIFSGRADTDIHLRLALTRCVLFPRLEGLGVPLRKIRHALIFHTTPFSDHKEVLYHMARLVSGTTDQMVFFDVVANVSDIPRNTPTTQLKQWTLLVVKIPLDSPQASEMAKMMGMLTWAIVPSQMSLRTCIIAREGLNGTLVIASQNGSKYEIVAYLTITDHQNGTILIPVKIDGTDQHRCDVEVTLKSPIRAGVMNSELFSERLIKGSLQVESETFVAF